MSLRRNALYSAAEVVVNGICLFVIYRHVAQVLGVSMLGVWGLVLSTTAFGRAADLGIAVGLARFVARSLEEGLPAQAALYIRTGVSFMGGVMGAVVLLLWWPFWWCLDFALDGAELVAAREVLPWAILSIWLLMVKSSLDSCLVGAHRADLRSVAGMAGMLLQLVASLMLVDRFQLQGLAWAQAGQFALAIALEITFLVAFTGLDRPTLTAGKLFSRPHFKEMISLGLTLQVGSLATLVFEPVAKSVLGAVAGTHVLGIFEMAYRASYQVKNVATMALQPSVALLAALTVRPDEELRAAFSRMCRTAALMAAILMTGLAVGSPVLSWLFLGRVDHGFVFTTGLMCITWAATIVAAPSYYLGIAMGKVWPYVGGEFVAAIVAPIAVYAFGASSLPYLAVGGILVGKVLGSSVPAILNRPIPRFGASAAAHPNVIAAFALVAVVGTATSVLAEVML